MQRRFVLIWVGEGCLGGWCGGLPGSCGDQLSCEGGNGSGRSSAADWDWSGVKHLDRMAYLVCLHYSGCPVSAYEDG